MRNPDFVYGTPRGDFVSGAFWKFNARGGDDNLLVDESSTPSPDHTIILFGKAGDDRLAVQDLMDIASLTVYGGSGNDLVRVLQGVGSGQAGDDVLLLVRDFDIPVRSTLKGGVGDDEFFIEVRAGTGTAIARGGDGGDVFFFTATRGTGHARLVGGDGADNFGRGGSVGRATIADFDFAEGDRLDVPDRPRIGPEGIIQEVGGTPEDPYLLVSFTWRNQGQDFFTAYKLLGLDAPLADAAFI